MTFDSFFKEEYDISIVELGLSDPFTVELDTITAEQNCSIFLAKQRCEKGQN